MTARDRPVLDPSAFEEVLRDAGVVAARSVLIRPQRFDQSRAHLAVASGAASGEHFTFRHPERAADLGASFPWATAVVAIACAYPRLKHRSGTLQVASYASSEAYKRLREALVAGVECLRGQGARAVAVSDANNSFDKSVARMAGIGWVGKHSLVMVPGFGASVVLGSIVLNAFIPVAIGKRPTGDPCRNCQRCIDACPVGAIVEPGVVAPRLCIASLLQDDRLANPERLSLGARVYGCDSCIDACPIGGRAYEEDPGLDSVVELGSSDAALLERHRSWYVPRHNPSVLRRNVLLAIAARGTLLTPQERRLIAYHAVVGDPMVRREALRCLVMSSPRSIRTGCGTCSSRTIFLPRSEGFSRTFTRSIVGQSLTQL
ncbi:MAG: epoxyqueuosine reductase [Ferrimicrobium sp.]